MPMSANAEMQPRVTMEYRPNEGRAIRIEGHLSEADRKAGVTAPAIELRPTSPGTRPAEGLIAGLIAAFTFPYRKGIQAPEGWDARKEEWERQAKLTDIRSQLK